MRLLIGLVFFFGFLLLTSDTAHAQKGSFQEWWWRDVPTHKLPHSVNSPLQKQRAEESYQRKLKAKAAQTQRRIADAQESAARQARIANKVRQEEKASLESLSSRVGDLEAAIQSLTKQLKAIQGL